jgi:hypothetical protein
MESSEAETKDCSWVFVGEGVHPVPSIIPWNATGSAAETTAIPERTQRIPMRMIVCFIFFHSGCIDVMAQTLYACGICRGRSVLIHCLDKNQGVAIFFPHDGHQEMLMYGQE